jgi:hypothetical protein
MRVSAICLRAVWALSFLLAADSRGMAQTKSDSKTTTWLCGNVVDAEGKPEAWRPMDLYAAPTGGLESRKRDLWPRGRGHFREGGITPGRYWLAVNAREPEKRWPIDLESQSSAVPCERWVQIRLVASGPQFEWHTRDDGWVDVGTDEDNTLTRICGRLNRTFLIKTKDPSVVDYKHKGLRDVRVVLYNRKPALKCCTATDLLQELVTGRGGKFEFKKVPTGAYWLAATVEGQTYKLPVRLQRRKEETEKLCSDNLFSLSEEGELSLWQTVYVD